MPFYDGKPCDIPEGCRFDVRVQMPADLVWNRGQKQSADAVADDEVTEQVKIEK
ncbi:hypothetical protein [Xenorhabdus mauleonii]|uniref:hypothetical protein n=1 Tax=Xenorhabdus mauleonii TaxID=351675 RepID=UPI0014746B18|nr:hypothetical protein [Xenorhabdus mauleonii]